MKPNALYITCEYNIFVQEYIKANLYKSPEAIACCLSAFEDNFLKLNDLFNDKLFDQDIMLATLVSLLKKDTKPKAKIDWKLNKYFDYLFNNGLTFYDHLQEAFLMHINHEKTIYKKYPKPYKLFFYISKEIKMFLFKIIRRICQKAKRDYYTNSSYYFKPRMIETIYLDEILLKRLELENPLLFSFYMLSISTNFNSNKIKNALKLNNPQYKKLKEELCHLIKQLLSIN